MPRRVWVSTTSFQRRGGLTVQDNLRRADRLIDIAAQDRPDIICLPELFGSLWAPHDRAEVFTRAGRTPEPQPPRRTRSKSFTF